MKKKLLFLCTGNSCRSQIAEGVANHLLSKSINIESAGTQAEDVNPIAIKVMKDIDIEISHHKSKKINFNDIKKYDLVITLCGDAKNKCPIFDSENKHIHWDIEDPAKFKGSLKDTHNYYADTRDIIYNKITELRIELI